MEDLETRIAGLLRQAEPLRALHDDDPEKARLSGIIDKINDLRRQQAEAVHLGQSPMENPRTGPTSTRSVDANAVVDDANAVEEGDDAAEEPVAPTAAAPARRRPGPKPGAKRAAKVKP